MIDSKVSDPKLRSTTPETKTAPLPQKIESRQALAPQDPLPAESEPTSEEVAALAYQLWVERGSPHGSHEEDWYQAEQKLRDTSQPKSKTVGA